MTEERVFSRIKRGEGHANSKRCRHCIGSLVGGMIGSSVGGMIGSSVGGMIGSSVGGMIGSLVGGMIGSLVGGMIGSLVGLIDRRTVAEGGVYWLLARGAF